MCVCVSVPRQAGGCSSCREACRACVILPCPSVICHVTAVQVELARRSQKKIGYTDEDLDLVGDDVALMQGVNNPHDAAAYREGDTVLDLGCGMGVDTRVAAARVGTSGRAIGLDLSAGEVAVAQQRAKDLKLTNVDYRVGDMEDLPFGDASIDVVISNGGFCLVPSKEKAFREIYRVLRPGGRVSIACTVRRQLLDSVRGVSCRVVPVCPCACRCRQPV